MLATHIGETLSLHGGFSLFNIEKKSSAAPFSLSLTEGRGPQHILCSVHLKQRRGPPQPPRAACVSCKGEVHSQPVLPGSNREEALSHPVSSVSGSVQYASHKKERFHALCIS